MLWPMPTRSGHRGRNDDRHQSHHARHANGEIGERLGIVQHIFGTDEAGTPEHDENRRRRTRGSFLEVLVHCGPDCLIMGHTAILEFPCRRPA